MNQLSLIKLRTKQNASAALNPHTVPHLFAIISSASIDLGCGNSRNSFLYACMAFNLNFNSFEISTKILGENFCGKYHSVEEGTSKEITSFTLEFFLGLVAVMTASQICL